MKISLRLTIFFAAIFAVLCFVGAVRSYLAIGDLTDPTEMANAKGYAMYWAFLGAIAGAFGLGAWWIARTQKDD